MSVLGKRKQLDGNNSQNAPPAKRVKRHKSDLNYTTYQYWDGEIVWARFEDFSWWPAQCEFPAEFEDKGQGLTPKLPIRWFGLDSHRVDRLTRDRVIPYSSEIESQLLDEIKVADEDVDEYNTSKEDAIAAQKKWKKRFPKEQKNCDEDFDPSVYTGTRNSRNHNTYSDNEDMDLFNDISKCGKRYNTRQSKRKNNNTNNYNDLNAYDLDMFEDEQYNHDINKCRKHYNTRSNTNNSGNTEPNNNYNSINKITNNNINTNGDVVLPISFSRTNNLNTNHKNTNNKNKFKKKLSRRKFKLTLSKPKPKSKSKAPRHVQQKEPIQQQFNDNSNSNSHITNHKNNNIVNCRQVDVSNIDLSEEKYCIQSAINDIKDMERRLSKIYPEQQQVANELYTQMQDKRTVFCMVYAPPQSGKTSIINATMKTFYENATVETFVPPENWFIFTSLSDIAIRDQLKERVPTKCKDNVYHRGQLKKKLAEKLKSKSNLIVFWDEFHIAAKQGQTQDRFLEWTGWNDIQILFKKNIRFIEMSATPNGLILQHLELDEENRSIIKMKTGQGYIGPYDLVQRKQVQRHKDLAASETCRILRDIYNQYGTHALYHFIRVKKNESEQTKQHFEQMIRQNRYDYVVIQFNQQTTKKENKNINKIIKDRPNVHTIILIKEMLRASITLYHKMNCGFFYERHTKQIDDSVIVQSFAGRLCGYDVPEHCKVFTSEESLKKINELYKHNWNTSIGWNSNTTTVKNDKTILKCPTYKNEVVKIYKAAKRKGRKSKSNVSKNNHNNINSNINNNVVGIICNDKKTTKYNIEYNEYDEKHEQYITKFKTFKKAKEFVKNQLKRNGKQSNFPQNSLGFFKDSLKKKSKNKKKDLDYFKVLTPDEIKCCAKYELINHGNSVYQQWVCYTNPDDKETVQFWVVWSENNLK